MITYVPILACSEPEYSPPDYYDFEDNDDDDDDYDDEEQCQ